ncbi:MAG TPA: hypothetical protein PLJ71_10250 [Candidatus Hydrogenedentes bacterium]|nr:hypothetical protein [Candidatus Hydrogenedentota bacterium]HQM49061.1 hypothetical protein [Candidatus Hydrogenedentota bacterium]
MWSPLSKLLEFIGAIRFPFLRRRAKLAVGRTDVPDARGTADWKEFLDARALSRVWGPHPHGPWTPFHCLTLFIAIDYLKREFVGPCEADPWPVREFRAPGWIAPDALLVVDLPGPRTVALGAALAASGCDLVCTFNNWPHPQGVLKAEQNLAAMLRYASWLEEKRVAYPTAGPVAWLCDAERLGTRKGRPGEFDNRYYIEDGVLPGPNLLRAQGISKIFYLWSQPGAVRADLGVQLYAYQKDGFQVSQVFVSDDGVLHDPEPVSLPTPSFSTMGFFRSSAGGFGAPVPHPSSGG